MYIANYLAENKDERVSFLPKACCLTVSLSVHSYGYVIQFCVDLQQVTNLLKEVEFIFVPFVNPDGYEVSSIN